MFCLYNYEEMYMDIGKNIRNCRIKNNLTQSEFAKLLGIDGTTLSGYESNRRLPDVYMMRKIADVLGVSVDSLML